MNRIILASHGGLSAGMKDTVQMILGEMPNLYALATLRDETGALQSLLAGISAAGASIVTINQSTPENGAALVAVTIRTDTMQMSPEELTEKLSRQRMVVGVRCGYNL